MTDYLAHVRRNEAGSFTIHELEDHVRAVEGSPSVLSNRIRDEILRNRQTEGASLMTRLLRLDR
ncbi:MAG: hypothetical protein JSS39_13790 [Nitrospira sp.]|nr:hypothetical protein [Nitrospira sp.]